MAAAVCTRHGPRPVDHSGTLQGSHGAETVLQRPTFHDLRRTSATGLVAAGVDVKTAQSRLGHSQVRLTLELYAQAVTEQDRNASDVLAAVLMPRRLA